MIALHIHCSTQTVSALHRAKQITTNWKAEVKVTKQLFIKAGYPLN